MQFFYYIFILSVYCTKTAYFLANDFVLFILFSPKKAIKQWSQFVENRSSWKVVNGSVGPVMEFFKFSSQVSGFDWLISGLLEIDFLTSKFISELASASSALNWLYYHITTLIGH